MHRVKVKCSFCGKAYFREIGRVNEAKKFGWNQYCSKECQSQAKVKRVEKVCANPYCNKKVSRELCQLRKSKSGLVFCSQSCATSFNNSKFPRRKAKVKICNYCGKEFKSEGAKYCSTECQAQAQIITKAKIIELIKGFYKVNKRIPLKRESHHYDAARLRFGTWNKAIETAGFKPNPVMFAKKHIANDGHKCDSLAEKIIDDWLYERKIKHKRMVPYPGNKSLTADFVVRNNWIEFLGLNGVIGRYDELVKKKRRLSKKYKLQLIEIYPKDLFPVNHLSEIIKINRRKFRPREARAGRNGVSSFAENRFALSLEYPTKNKFF